MSKSDGTRRAFPRLDPSAGRGGLAAPPRRARRTDRHRRRRTDRHHLPAADQAGTRQRHPPGGARPAADRSGGGGDRGGRGGAVRVPVRPADARRPALPRRAARPAARSARLSAAARRTRPGPDPHRAGGVALHHRPATRPGSARDGPHVGGGAAAVRPGTRDHGGALPAADPGRPRHRAGDRRGGGPRPAQAVRGDVVGAATRRRPGPARGGDRHRGAGGQGVRAGGPRRRPARTARSRPLRRAHARRPDQRRVRRPDGGHPAARARRRDRARRLAGPAGHRHRRHVPRVRRLPGDDDGDHPHAVVGGDHGAALPGGGRAGVRGDRHRTRRRRPAAPGAVAGGTARAGPRFGDLRLRARPARPRRSRSRTGAGRDRRRGRRRRLRQDRAVAAATPVLCPRVRDGVRHRRRRRTNRRRGPACRAVARGGEPGVRRAVPVLGHDRREHRARPARGERRGDPRRRAGGVRGRVRRGAPRGVRHRGRRAGADALRWAAAAGRAGPCVAARSSGADSRRRDLGRGRGDGGRDLRGAAGTPEAHHADPRAPAVHALPRRPGRGARRRPRGRLRNGPRTRDAQCPVPGPAHWRRGRGARAGAHRRARPRRIVAGGGARLRSGRGAGGRTAGGPGRWRPRRRSDERRPRVGRPDAGAAPGGRGVAPGHRATGAGHGTAAAPRPRVPPLPDAAAGAVAAGGGGAVPGGRVADVDRVPVDRALRRRPGRHAGRTRPVVGGHRRGCRAGAAGVAGSGAAHRAHRACR